MLKVLKICKNVNLECFQKLESQWIFKFMKNKKMQILTFMKKINLCKKNEKKMKKSRSCKEIANLKKKTYSKKM